ncbi:hypothetical protein H0H87_008804 [Tephrocybe sp. NHM501043]|nr:hypothetical protein H0H87_008804 [Tephrocybe sp. NHM501043]
MFTINQQIIAALLRLSADYAVGACTSFPMPFEPITVLTFLGLPLGIYLAFQWDFQLRGLWMGLTTGLACGALTGVSICLRTDWQQEVWRTMIRLKENNNPNTPSGGESLVQGIDV